MELEDRLDAMERQFWLADAAYYEQHVAADALMVLPEPAGLQRKDQVVRSIAASQRWSEVELENVTLLRLGERNAILHYRALARRPGQEARYAALVSSVYTSRDQEWKLVFHQQTPITLT